MHTVVEPVHSISQDIGLQPPGLGDPTGELGVGSSGGHAGQQPATHTATSSVQPHVPSENATTSSWSRQRNDYLYPQPELQQTPWRGHVPIPSHSTFTAPQLQHDNARYIGPGVPPPVPMWGPYPAPPPYMMYNGQADYMRGHYYGHQLAGHPGHWMQQQHLYRHSPHKQYGRGGHTPRTPRDGSTPTPRGTRGRGGRSRGGRGPGRLAEVEARIKQIELDKKRAEELAEQMSAQAAKLLQEKSAMAAEKQMLESERDHLMQRVQFMEQVVPMQSPEHPREQLLEELERLQDEMQRMQLEKVALQQRLHDRPDSAEGVQPALHGMLATSTCSSVEGDVPTLEGPSRAASIHDGEGS